ncbi:MAG TPA: S41 family peptidase [Candidatus Latescibacteria bacterium]|nr:S41 family peptidase [Candidatus Latescibacterota bacterium]
MLARKAFWRIVSVLVMLGWLSTGIVTDGTWASEPNLYTQLRVLADVLTIVRDNYVDEVDQAKLIDGAIDGVLSELDPHSNYLTPEELDKTIERIRGDFEGIGIEFDIRDGFLTVIAPIEGSPSDRLGIRAGDKIVKINGESAIGITRQEVFEKLRGPKGTKVNVSIKREGEEELLEFQIVRDTIPIYSIPCAFLITPEIGYIRISRFSTRTSEELEDALRRLEAKGMKKLLLDVRWNGGGPLAQAIEVTDKFINEGKICYTRGRIPGSITDFYASRKGTYTSIPLIVMINHGSASASEILSGAIQDNDRGLVVGQTSFGKGLVQREYKLRNGGALFLTTAKWYTPSGRLIQRPYEGKSKADYVAEAFEDNKAPEVDKPVFYTVKGRKVYGGGGITPDVILESPPPIRVREHLKGKNAFFEFAIRYVGGHPKITTDFDEFRKDFQVTNQMIKDFKMFLAEKGIDFEETEFEENIDVIKRSIKAEIAGELWGSEEKYQIYVEGDPEVLQALNLFDKAEALLGP